MGATLRIVMGATYLIVALLRIDTKSYPQCSNEVRGTYMLRRTHAVRNPRSMVGLHRPLPQLQPVVPLLRDLHQKGPTVGGDRRRQRNRFRGDAAAAQRRRCLPPGRRSTPEVLRFEDVVDGQALRAVWSGHEFFRDSHGCHVPHCCIVCVLS